MQGMAWSLWWAGVGAPEVSEVGECGLCVAVPQLTSLRVGRRMTQPQPQGNIRIVSPFVVYKEMTSHRPVLQSKASLKLRMCHTPYVGEGE